MLGGRDVAQLVEGGQVAARRNVAGLELDVEAGRRQRAPAELVLERVVAEQPEVTGARPWRDAGADGLDQAGRARRRQPVEVRRLGFLQLAASRRRGVPAEPSP